MATRLPRKALRSRSPTEALATTTTILKLEGANWSDQVVARLGLPALKVSLEHLKSARSSRHESLIFKSEALAEVTVDMDSAMEKAIRAEGSSLDFYTLIGPGSTLSLPASGAQPIYLLI